MFPTILLGKTTQKLSRLRGNGGSALPGLVVERTNPNFIKKVLGKLQYGVVVISGTNGKTTTTKIVTELLEKQGLKVFTNRTGSNFVRGVISAILQKIKLSGKFDYDIAILELDEAHAVKFAEIIPIKYSLLLNVHDDQVDRFGNIDHVAKLLAKIADHTKDAVVINREDPRLSQISIQNAIYFGLSPSLTSIFSSKAPQKPSKLSALVTLEHIKDNSATYKIANRTYQTTLQLKGIYNAYNSAAALALVKTILPGARNQQLVSDLSRVTSAFGRGETFTVNDATVELFLVKNPSAFQLSLVSFVDSKHDFMIAINNTPADGRDTSWLSSVDFTSLPHVQVISGTCAADMSLHLKKAKVPFGTINQDLISAVDLFLKSGTKPKRIFATYTAMLRIRKYLSKLTNAEKIL